MVLRTKVLLSIDPGLTTGWALLTPLGDVLDCGNLLAEDVGEGILGIIAKEQDSGLDVDALVEVFPLATAGDLSASLRKVVLDIEAALTSRKVPTFTVTPGVWKTSSVPETPPMLTGKEGRLTRHERDAIRMGRYHLRSSK